LQHSTAAALRHLRVAATCCPPAGARGAGTFLCFQHYTPGDLLVGSAKVVGSAQRRARSAFLQHGSILLARSPYAPALAGIRELTGRDLAIAEVCAAVRN